MRCREHFQGDKCRLEENHSGKHRSPLHEWDHAQDNLPPTRRERKGIANGGPGKGFRFYLACKQFNRENPPRPGDKSTASRVRQFNRQEQRRLAELGRIRDTHERDVLARVQFNQLLRGLL